MASKNGSHAPHTLTDLQDMGRLLYRPPAGPLPQLPERYGRAHLALMARDPNWLFAYWECGSGRATLTVSRIEPGTRAMVPILETEVSGVGSYYVEVPLGGEEYVAAIVDERGTRCESRPVRTPPGRVSDCVDEGWETTWEIWEEGERPDASSPGAMRARKSARREKRASSPLVW